MGVENVNVGELQTGEGGVGGFDEMLAAEA